MGRRPPMGMSFANTWLALGVLGLFACTTQGNPGDLRQVDIEVLNDTDSMVDAETEVDTTETSEPSDTLEVDSAIEDDTLAIEDSLEVGEDTGGSDSADTAAEDVADSADVAVEDVADTTDTADAAFEDSADTADIGDDSASDVVPDIVAVDDTALPDTAIAACDPPLSVDEERFALVRQLRKIAPTGGSGVYRFELMDAPSGAILNRVTGEYISGPTAGVTDRVRVTEASCADEVVVEVHVVEGMLVRPSQVELRPGQSFRPAPSRGSGSFDLRLALTGTSGATLEGATWNERRFVAGPVEGFELLIVQDLETGETRDINVIIDTDAVPAFSPPWLFLPPGAAYPVTSVSGSGDLLTTPVGEGPTFVDDPADPPRRWEADTLGVSRLDAVDTFLDDGLVQHAVGLAGSGPVAQKSGQQAELWTALAPGDLDGDGFAEAIVGAGERTLTLPVSGGVYVYRGGENGPSPSPWRVFSGEIRNEQFGAALTQGDFDGDGLSDLVIGGPRYRVGTILPGRAVVYSGVAGEAYSAAPVWTGTGLRNGDLFGHALAACDFDGDGYDDLAVGAYESEDNVAPVVSNQGGVFLYRGGPGGLLANPAQTIWGRVPTATGPAAEVDLRFGRVLVCGDLDGDGAGELAVGSPSAGADNGAVWVYAGDGSGVGLVMPTPAVVWRGTRADRLGFALAIGRLRGDTSGADLVMTEPRWSTSANNNDSHGAIHFIAGGPWVENVAAAVNELPYDRTVLNPNTTGNDTNDELGFRVEIGDMNADGRADLLVAGIADEVTCTGCGTNAGAVHVLAGLEVGWPSFPALHTVAATTSTDRQGSAIAILGPVDATGQHALLSVLGRDDSQGADYGRAMVLWPQRPGPSFNAVQATLDMPALEFGWRVAQGLEVMPDLDGDGFDEVVLGTPQGAGPPPSGIPQAFSGFFTVHKGRADGVDAAPWATGSGFRRHSGSDRWGFEVAMLEDFDGDGRVDLAVVGRNEDQATNYGTGTLSTAACNVARSDNGAVAIFATGISGVETQPMLMHFGPQASQVIEVVAGADVDGDALTDLITGSRFWDRPTTGTGDNGGGFEVVKGRPRADTTSTSIVCEPERRHFGLAASDGFAAALVSLGDLDDDGCDEVAVGIPGADLLGGASGAVEIFYGAGALCATSEVRRLVLAAPTANTGLGNAVYARDLDGDGLSELMVGGSTHRVGAIAAGAAWVVPGSILAGLTAQATPRADEVAATPVRLFGVDGLVLNGIAGTVANELFGTQVALIPPRGDSGPLIAVSTQASVVGGMAVGGLVMVYRLELNGADTAVVPRPLLVAGGEAHGGLPTARMATLVGPAGRHLLVGASESSAVAPFSGALWVVPLDGLAALENAVEGQ